MALGQLADAQLDVVCDHQSAGGPTVTHVRGTVIANSLSTLREAGLYERYLALLPASSHEAVLLSLASSWLPVEVAVAHYEACEQLGLGAAELTEIGERLATRYAGTLIATLLQSSRAAGVDAPWVGLRAQGRIWDRMYVGGGAKIYRLGPKDALGEFYGLPLVRFRYFRAAFCAYYQGLATLVVKRAYVKPMRPLSDRPDTFAIGGSWV